MNRESNDFAAYRWAPRTGETAAERANPIHHEPKPRHDWRTFWQWTLPTYLVVALAAATLVGVWMGKL